MIPDSPTPDAYGFHQYGAYNCSGEQMPFFQDTQRAAAFIRQSASANQPFFVQVWIHEPHTPFHTLPKYEWQFKHLPEREDQIYASVIAHADDRIGQLLLTLDSLKLAKNTLVIFSSDNGPARAASSTELLLQYDTATGAGWGIAASKGETGGRRGYKSSLFEGGIGVPFLIRWPGVVAPGRVDDQSLISAVDLMPTLLEVAGVVQSKELALDGISMLQAWKGRPMPHRTKPLFWHFDAPWPAPRNRPDHWGSWAMVHGSHKLVANRDFTHLELFDMRSDMSESTPLHDAKAEQSRVMLSALREWKAQLPSQPTGRVFSSMRDQKKP